MAVLGSLSLTVLMISVSGRNAGNVELEQPKSELRSCVKVGGGRPELPVINSPYGLYGRNLKQHHFR